MTITHHIIRIGDGNNFKNSLNKGLFVVGLKEKWLPDIKKFKSGDILWFLMNKSKRNKFLGFAIYVGYENLNDNLISFSNSDYGWAENDEWSILLSYIRIHIFPNRHIFRLSVPNQRTIMTYKNKMKEQIISSSVSFQKNNNLFNYILKVFYKFLPTDCAIKKWKVLRSIEFIQYKKAIQSGVL